MYPVYKTHVAQSSNDLGISVGNSIIDIHVSGKGAAKICELVHRH